MGRRPQGLPDELMTLSEAARLLKVNPSTIQAWIRRGKRGGNVGKIVGASTRGGARVMRVDIERILAAIRESGDAI
jgi:predicted site-specific integrase-resolvase